MRQLLPLLLVLLALPGTARAGSITARMDRTELAVGQATMLAIDVQGSADSDPTLTAPDGLDVEMVSRSMKTQLSRGRTSVLVSYGYRVSGVKEGTWILGPARATVDGQTKASESFEVKVVAASGGQQGTRRTSRGEPAQPRGGASPGRQGGEYFAVASVSDDRPYAGESLTYEVEMGRFGSLRIAGRPQWEQPPMGTLSAEPGVRIVQDDRQQMIDGSRYTVNKIRVPVFGVEPGAVEIDPAVFEMTVVRSGGGFFGRHVPVSFESNKVSLRVRPLPSRGQPPDFSGVVGRFLVEAELDRDQVETDDTATLTIRVAGVGSLRGRRPTLKAPDTFQLYEETPEVTSRMAADGLRTEVIQRVHLQPQDPGTFELPGVELSFFDPERGRYQVARSGPLLLQVTGEPVPDSAVVSRSAALLTAKEQVEVLGTDILPLHTGPRMHGDARVGLGSPLVLGLLLLPLLGFGGLAVLVSRERMAGTAGGQRRLRKKTAKTARAAARKAADSGDAEAAEAALREYLTARLQRSGAALSPDDGPRAVAEAGAPGELAEALGTLLSRLEAARYGGADDGSLAREIDGWIRDAEASWS